MKQKELVFMKQSDIKILKEKIWKKNNKICPILGKEIPLENAVLDHKHKLKSEDCSHIKGAIRTHLDMRANALAGKIENNFTRYFGKNPEIDLPSFLRNMADYLEKGSYFEIVDDKEIYYIHPNETPKRKKVKISEYKRVSKYYLDIFPRKKKVIKKPTYVNDDWIALVNLTEKHILKLQEEKENRRQLRKTRKI